LENTLAERTPAGFQLAQWSWTCAAGIATMARSVRRRQRCDPLNAGKPSILGCLGCTGRMRPW
jgi:hypothetical protein